jgi:hypothetical protein
VTKQFVLALAIAAGALMPAAAQDKPQPSVPAAPAPGGGRWTPLKVQLTLTRLTGEKKISSVPYMVGVLTNAEKTSLRLGVQVPVIQTVFGAKTDAATAIPQSSYTYRNVGTNIDCQAQDIGNGSFRLSITVEDSAIHVDGPAGSAEDRQHTARVRDVPAFRSFYASFSTVLRDGQTMQYASATDPVSGEVMRIDVGLSLAK